MRTVTFDQVFEEAKKMKVGEERTFNLSEEPGKFQVATLCGSLAIAGTGNAFSIRRSGRVLDINCYVPK